MLTSTYIHSPGIGPNTERSLWRQGARTWDLFLQDPLGYRLPQARRAALLDTVVASKDALLAGDHRYFAQTLKPRDQWRAVDAFSDSLAYLDIETTGAGYDSSVTVIGLYDGRDLHQFVSGENLLDFLDVIDQYKVLVTFFGTGFDLPVLSHQFPSLRFTQIHVDLCFVYRRLGLKGGLKAIEKQMGIAREADTEGLSGWDAVRLWWEYRRGRDESLQTLLRYNEADVRHLETLLNHGCQELTRQCFGE